MPRITRLAGITTVVALAASFALSAPGPAGAAATTATRTALTHSADPLVGTTVRLVATVSPHPSGGTVRFGISGTAIAGCGAVAVHAATGRAVCRTVFHSAGARTVHARFSGYGHFAASSGATTVRVARAVGTVIGGTGSCTTSTGMLTAVDFRHWRGPIVRGCGFAPSNGVALLRKAGFSVAGTKRYGLAFVCRIGSPKFYSGKQFPTPAQDPCIDTPPADAYWGYWIAPKGTNTWKYSTTGASSYRPKAGEADAWVFGGGKPAFTPATVRAGLPAGSAGTAVAPRGVTGGTDLGAAVAYLTGRLKNGTHYEPYGPGFADIGLTVDGAFALAATGSADTTLAAVTAYVASHLAKYTGLGTSDPADDSSGAMAKVALLAEVTGNDPTSFGGQDLLQALRDRTCTSAGTGCVGAGEYRGAATTFSQAYGVLAQLRAGDTAGAASPVQFLESEQRASGAFPSEPGGSGSDVDSTAVAAMALSLAKTAKASTAVDTALAWIAGRQRTDGGFPGTAGDSTNSAGLAIQALTLAGAKYRTRIDHALALLASTQDKDGGFPISADGSAPGSDVRATTQVVSGVVGTPLSSLTDDVTMPTPRARPDAAARFLISSLVHGDHLEYAGGYGPNYGGTADSAIALAAAGGHDVVLKRVLRYLIAHVADYADPNGTGTYPGPYTGAAGKLAVLAEITGQNPRDLGGFDLLATLIGNVCTAAKGGAYGPCSATGDFYQAYSTAGQAFGVLALARAGVHVPSAALKRLESLQCADGGFSSTLITDPAKCSSDVDSTGFAVQALALLPGAAAAVTHAVSYLRLAQQSDGGWIGAAGENSNSTALAVQGLLAAPAGADQGAAAPLATQADPAVKNGVAFLAGLQNGDGGFGVSAATPGSDALATAQVLPAVRYATLSELHHPVALGAGTGGPSASTSAPATSSSASSSTPPSTAPASDTLSATDTLPVPSPTGSSSDVAGGTLPDTGSPTGALLGWAAALLALGVALTVAGRRRAPAVARRRRRMH